LHVTSETDIHQAIGLLERGKTREALACLLTVNTKSETNTLRCNLAGLVCLAAKDNRLALEWFDHALALNPANLEALSNRGLALHELGRAGDALAAYDEAIRAGCVKPVLFYNCGNLLRGAGRLTDAIASYDMALRLDPSYPEALHAGGLVLSDLGHYQSALEFFDEALRLRPSFINALIDRGNLLQNLGRWPESLQSYDAALAEEPGRADILNNRGSAYVMLGRMQEADVDFAKALRIDPRLPQAWSNRGNLFIKLQQPAAALAAYEKAMALRPHYVEAHCGRAVALKYLGRFDEALEAFDAALACDPASPHVNNNKGVLLLLRGHFEQGFDLYEYRWSLPGIAKQTLAQTVPEWKGENLNSCKIAVFDELGLGDAIQFARYLPLLAGQGARVTFFCRGTLHRLFKTLGTQIELREQVDASESFDRWIALSSLPRAFKTRLATIPASPSYLRAELPLVQEWAARTGSHSFKIGVCWRGSQNVNADPSRSIPLACFGKLAAIDGVRLFSIQKADGGDDDGVLTRLTFLGEDFDAGADAFLDAAAVMQNLDLIVTCDTSIAHLAGALGSPVFVLLKQVPDWRWLLDREDSPWYPSMRLFRQKASGDWDEVFDRVALAVAAILNRSSQANGGSHSRRIAAMM
jgi:tetratricopeptide (TPR) repeat protein